MADQNPPELQGRLDNFQNRNAKKPTSRIGVGALAAGLGLGGAALAYVFASSLQDAADPLQTSDVETFQDQRTGNGGRLEFPADEEDQRVEDALIAVEEALEPQVAEPVPAPAPDETVLRELAALREALAASQSARNSEIQAAVSDLREAFDAQTDALEASIAEKDEELAATARENAARLSGLQAMLDAERAQRESLESELTQSSLIADQRLLEERRRLEEEDRARAYDGDVRELDIITRRRKPHDHHVLSYIAIKRDTQLVQIRRNCSFVHGYEVGTVDYLAYVNRYTGLRIAAPQTPSES